MIQLQLKNSELNGHAIYFIKSLRASLPLWDKSKVESSMGISKADYNRLIKGKLELDVVSLTGLSREFNFSLKALGEGKIDIESVINKYLGKCSGIPRRYEGKIPRVKNYFIISALQNAERIQGPNLKKLALDYLQLEDHLYKDPEDFVNLEVLEDLLIFFHDHGMSEEEITNLGVCSFNGILGLPVFGNFENPQHFFKFFYEEFASKEAASHYHWKLIKNSNKGLTVQIKDTPETLEYNNGDPLGSPYCCLYIQGGIEETLRFQGIDNFSSSHPQCRHRGDEFCIFEFNHH